MSKSIVLARPHPFIVGEMQPFLESMGYILHKGKNLEQVLQGVPGAAAAIISLAITSPIEESPEQVCQALRKTRTDIPLVFASLLELDKVRCKLRSIAEALGIDDATIAGVHEQAGVTLGSPASFLYISKSDMEGEANRQETARTLLRHLA